MRKFNFFLTAFFLLPFVQLKAQCTANGSHFTAYDYPNGWTSVHISPAAAVPTSSCDNNEQGSIYASGTAVEFFTARGGREMRISRDIPTLSNQSWTMDFILHTTSPANGNLESNSPAVTLASLSSESASLTTGCTGGSTICQSCVGALGGYSYTEMDAMSVMLTSTPPTACYANQSDKNWRIYGYARDAYLTSATSPSIPIPSGQNGIYYVRLQRNSATSATISVCSNPNYTGHLPGSPQCFTIPAGVQDLDVLNHEVGTEGSCLRVFNGIVDHLKIDNGFSCPIQALTPAFTLPATLCQGQAITANATASAGLPISSHSWGIQECDAFGNGIGNAWWTTSTNGPPAAFYTFPASTPGLTIGCGKYYKVYLKVQNGCTAIPVNATRIVQIKCAPGFSISPNVSICQGQSTTLSVDYRGIANYNVRWSVYPTGQILYQGPFSNSALSVTPTTTTQYQATVTDNTTGCSSSQLVTVTVYSNNPAFSATVNASHPDYFTVGVVPVDLNGYSYPGFGYGYTVEEINPATGAAYYAVSTMGNGYTACWWNYSAAPETFNGFVSTGTGTMTYLTGATGAGCGTIGRFLYNHTYRITRLVVNDYCAPVQVSALITYVKSGEPVIEYDVKAPDMTHLLTAGSIPDSEINIFPNPSSGIFTIELEGSEGALIEVINALGENVKSFETKDARTDLDMTGFAKGIYIVAITANGSTTTKKIVLE